jgi:serine/threonine-protein kinase HipA
LIQLAQQGGLDVRWAEQRLDAMLEVVDQWPLLIESFDIRRATRQKMQLDVQHQRAVLMH